MDVDESMELGSEETVVGKDDIVFVKASVVKGSKRLVGGPGSPEVIIISVVSSGRSENGYGACEVEITGSSPLRIIVVAVGAGGSSPGVVSHLQEIPR